MAANPSIFYCTPVNQDFSATRMSWVYGLIVVVGVHVSSSTFQNQNISTWESRYNSRSPDRKFGLLRPNYHEKSNFYIVGLVPGMYLESLIALGMQRHDPDRLLSPERSSTVKVSGDEHQNFHQIRNRVQRSQIFSRIPRGNVLSVEYEGGEMIF